MKYCHQNAWFQPQRIKFFENSGTQTTTRNIVRRTMRCSAGSLTCPCCTNVSTKSWAGANCHVAKKHSTATIRVVHKLKKSYKSFYSFCFLQEHLRKDHGTQSGWGAQFVEVTPLIGDIDDKTLREKLQKSKHSSVDSEMEFRRHTISTFALDTLDPNCLLEKLDAVSDSPEFAADPNVAFGFVLKNVEDASCRYSDANGNTTLLERSKLVATKDNASKIKNLLSETDIIESCRKQAANRKWKLYVLKNPTIFFCVAKGSSYRMWRRCIARSTMKHQFVICSKSEEKTRLPHNDNFCLFRPLALHLPRKERLEKKTSKSFNLCLKKTGAIDSANFRRNCTMEDIATVQSNVPTHISPVEGNVPTDNSLYDVDLVDGSMAREIRKRNIVEHGSIVRLWRYKGHVCSVFFFNKLFKTYRPFCVINLMLELSLPIFTERNKHPFPKNLYHFWGRL